MLSIIIATKRKDEINRCLDSINKYTKDFEVILVEREAGYNEKLNEGFKKAKGDYIAILHDDNEVLEGWADQLEDVGAFHVGEMKDTLQIHGGTFDGRYAFNESPDYTSFIEMSREVAEKVFPLDENYQSPWCADVDMGHKIKELGYTIKPLKGKIIHWHGVGAGVGHKENEDYCKEKWNK